MFGEALTFSFMSKNRQIGFLFCYFASFPQTRIWKEVLFPFSCSYFKVKAGRPWGTPTFPLCRHTQRSLCGFTPIRNLPDISRWTQMSFLFRAVFAMPCDLRKKAALIFFFLRDIRWCLMSLFGSVIPSLFYTVQT